MLGSKIEELYVKAAKSLKEVTDELIILSSSSETISDSTIATNEGLAKDQYTATDASASSLMSFVSSSRGFSDLFSGAYTAELSQRGAVATETSLSDALAGEAKSLFVDPDGSYDIQSLAIAGGAALVGAGLAIYALRARRQSVQEQRQKEFVNYFKDSIATLDIRLAEASNQERLAIVETVIDALVRLAGSEADVYEFIYDLGDLRRRRRRGQELRIGEANFHERIHALAAEQGITTLEPRYVREIRNLINSNFKEKNREAFAIDPRMIRQNLLAANDESISQSIESCHAILGAEAYFIVKTGKSRGEFWKILATSQWTELPEGLAFLAEARFNQPMRKAFEMRVNGLGANDFNDFADMLDLPPKILIMTLSKEGSSRAGPMESIPAAPFERLKAYATGLKEDARAILNGSKDFTNLAEFQRAFAQFGLDPAQFIHEGRFDSGAFKAAALDLAYKSLEIPDDATRVITVISTKIIPKFEKAAKLSHAVEVFQKNPSIQSLFKLLPALGIPQDEAGFSHLATLLKNPGLSANLEAKIQAFLGQDFALEFPNEEAFNEFKASLRNFVGVVSVYRATIAYQAKKAALNEAGGGHLTIQVFRDYLDGIADLVGYGAEPFSNMVLRADGEVTDFDVNVPRAIKEAFARFKEIIKENTVLFVFLPVGDRQALEAYKLAEVQEQAVITVTNFTSAYREAYAAEIQLASRQDPKKFFELISWLSVSSEYPIIQPLMSSYEEFLSFLNTKLRNQMRDKVLAVLPAPGSLEADRLVASARLKTLGLFAQSFSADPTKSDKAMAYISYLAFCQSGGSQDKEIIAAYREQIIQEIANAPDGAKIGYSALREGFAFELPNFASLRSAAREHLAMPAALAASPSALKGAVIFNLSTRRGALSR